MNYLSPIFSKIALSILLIDMMDMKPEYSIQMLKYVWKKTNKSLSNEDGIE